MTDSLSIIRKRLEEIDARIVTVRLATVASTSSTEAIVVVLDNDPGQTEVEVLNLGGTYETGTRVLCLAYGERGLVVLGTLDGLIRLSGTGDASATSTGHNFQSGRTDGANIRIDNNEIMAVNNGSLASLNLNPDGGSVVVNGASGGSGIGVLVPNGGEVSLASTNHFAQWGDSAGLNMRFDSNEIQVANAGIAATLSLNGDGGSVNTGAALNVGTALDVATTAVTGGNVNIGGDLDVLGGDIRIVGNMDCQPPVAGTTANCNLNTTGGFERLRKNTSSRLFKTNIADLDVSAEKILALRPVQFQSLGETDPETGEVLTAEQNTKWHPGFIAEEAREAGLDLWVPSFAHPGYDHEVLGFSYDVFVAAHQLVLREQQARIEALEGQVSRLLARSIGPIEGG